MSERNKAIALAARVLDMPGQDPDRDIAILARQFLRAIQPEQAEAFLVWVIDEPKLLRDLTPEELTEAEDRIMHERSRLSLHAPESVVIFYQTAATAFATERARRAAS